MLALLALIGTMLFVTFFGKTFGESLAGIGEGVSKLLSPQIKPAFVPTIGLEFTPGIWTWWESAKPWLTWIQPSGGDNVSGGDNNAGGDGGYVPAGPSLPSPPRLPAVTTLPNLTQVLTSDVFKSLTSYREQTAYLAEMGYY